MKELRVQPPCGVAPAADILSEQLHFKNTTQGTFLNKSNPVQKLMIPPVDLK